MAGLIMDNADSHWVWYAAVMVSLVTAPGFVL
jgi:hypothetical protein